MICIVLNKTGTTNSAAHLKEIRILTHGKASLSGEDNMARKYFEQMLSDELELGNYLGFQRWYANATSNPLCYNLPELNQDFRNTTRPSRFDMHALEYYRQLYWMPQGVIFPSYEPFPLLKRSEKRVHQGKGYHFSREKRSNGEKRFYSNQAEDVISSKQVERGKPDLGPHFERRYQQSWNREPQHCHLSRDRRNPCYLSYRSSNVDLNVGGATIDQQLYNFKQMLENRNPSLDCIANENLPHSSCNSRETADYLESQAINRSSSEIDWKNQIVKSSKNKFSEGSDFDASSSLSNSCESWYCPEEQQQIVDFLKEVNLRHDRQLESDRLSYNEQASFDESRMTCNDVQSLDSLRKSSPSSEEEDDHINIILFPREVPSIVETGVKADAEVKTEYNEKSASDFIEEFQNIFTGSPEKKIINNMTKESLKKSQEAYENNFGEEIQGKCIMNEDREAVKTVLDFDGIEDTEEGIFRSTKFISSSPKKIFTEVFLEKDLDKSAGKQDAVEISDNDKIRKTVLKPLNAELNWKSIHIKNKSDKIESSEKHSCMKSELQHKSNLLSPNSKKEYFEEMSHKTKQTGKHDAINFCASEFYKLQYSKEDKFIEEREKEDSQGKLEFEKSSQVHTHCAIFNESVYSKSHRGTACGDNEQNTENKDTYYHETSLLRSGKIGEGKSLDAINKNIKTVGKSISESCLIQKTPDVFHKRISVSEIFDSVKKYEEKYHTVSAKQYCLNNLKNPYENLTYLTPSEHLKKILGIGEDSEKNKAEKKQIRKEFRGPDKEQHFDTFLSPSSSKTLSESKKEDVQSISPLSTHAKKISDYENCGEKTSLSTENKTYLHWANSVTGLVETQKVYESPTVSNDFKSLKEGNNCTQKSTNFVPADKNISNGFCKRDGTLDPGVHSEFIQITQEDTASHQKVSGENLSDRKVRPQSSITSSKRNITLPTDNSSSSSKNEQASRFNSRFNEQKKTSKKDKYSTYLKDSELSVTDEKHRSRKEVKSKLNSPKTSRTGRKKLKFISKDFVSYEEDQSRILKLIQKKEVKQSLKKHELKKSSFNSPLVTKTENSIKNNIFQETSNCVDYASGAFQKRYNDLISKFNQEAERRKFGRSVKKEQFSTSLSDHANTLEFQDSTTNVTEWRFHENNKISKVQNNRKDSNLNVERNYTKDKYWKGSSLDIDWYSSGNYNDKKHMKDYSKYEKGKNLSKSYKEFPYKFDKFPYNKEIKNTWFNITNRNKHSRKISNDKDADFAVKQIDLTTDISSSFISKEESISKIESFNYFPKLLYEISQCAYSNVTHLCISDSSPRYMNFSIFDTMFLYSVAANSILLVLISDFQNKNEQRISTAENFFDLQIKKNVYSTLKDCRLDLDRNVQDHRGNRFILAQKTGHFSNVSNSFPRCYTLSLCAMFKCRIKIFSPHSSLKKVVYYTLGAMQAKVNDSETIICNRETKNGYKKSSFSVLISKERKMKNIDKGCLTINIHILIAKPNVLHKYLKNIQDLKFNHLLDVYIHLNLWDILFLFSSVKQSPALSQSLRLSVIPVIDKNLFRVIPQLLNLLSVLSILNIPWSCDNLKKLLELCICLRDFNDSKLLKLHGKETYQIYTSQVLNCWDIISSFMKENNLFQT